MQVDVPPVPPVPLPLPPVLEPEVPPVPPVIVSGSVGCDWLPLEQARATTARHPVRQTSARIEPSRLSVPRDRGGVKRALCRGKSSTATSVTSIARRSQPCTVLHALLRARVQRSAPRTGVAEFSRRKCRFCVRHGGC